ncbi:MAG: DNA-processing protein DprA [Oscillospiraceae bacterium]|nr:DNA-processing protein DprA [Oscillospiraceae bacterium]
MDEDLIYWLWLNELTAFKKRTILKAVKKFGTAKRVFQKLHTLHLNGKLEKIIKGNINFSLKKAENILNECQKYNYSIIKYSDKIYPTNLKYIYSPPITLFAKGKIEILNRLKNTGSICVVGSRKTTEYGEQITKSLIKDLVKAGIIIISGFAVGIDAVAHRTALKEGGATIAVLGCGLNINYPLKNNELKEEMLNSNGLFLSEYPPNQEATRFTFPVRNRILAGISDAVLVTEAGAKSGSLITAGFALEQSKDVFVVPHNIGIKEAEGSNKLLKDGALMVLEANDILLELQKKYATIELTDSNLQKTLYEQQYEQQNNQNTKKVQIKESVDLNLLSKNAKKFYNSLEAEEKELEYLVQKSGLALSDALVAVTELELLGAIKTLPGPKYSK